MAEGEPEKDATSDIFNRDNQASFLFLALLVISIIAAFITLNAYLNAIILGALFAAVFYPLHLKVQKKIKDKPNISAMISTVIIALMVITPILIFSVMLTIRGISVYGDVQQKLESEDWQKELGRWDTEKIYENLDADEPDEEYQNASGKLILKFYRYKREYFPDLDPVQELKDGSSNIMSFIGDKIFSGLKAATALSINFVLMLFIMFYFFKDGHRIVGYIMTISPLSTHDEILLIERIKTVGRSAIIGTIATAVVQGALGMVGFAIAGIPWFFWGFVMGFASLIPVVGTALVWVPCTAYLFMIGQSGSAIFLLIWSVVVVGMSDNFVRPYFMKGDTGMSSVIAFFSILGGMNIFGILGIIYGPMIFGICAILLYIYNLKNEKRKSPEELEAACKVIFDDGNLGMASPPPGEELDDDVQIAKAVPPPKSKNEDNENVGKPDD